MTFDMFNNLLKSKYPDAIALSHGELSGTEFNKKVALSFTKNGKVYTYYGAYEDILCKIGINTISQSRFNSTIETLKELEKTHGTEDLFFGFTIDNSDEIKKYRTIIKEYQTNYIIV